MACSLQPLDQRVRGIFAASDRNGDGGLDEVREAWIWVFKDW